MNHSTLLIIIFIAFILLGIILVLFLLLGQKKKEETGVKTLMGAQAGTENRTAGSHSSRRPDPKDIDIETIRRQTRRSGSRQNKDSLSFKLFRAGFFTAADKRRFFQFRVLSFIISIVFFPAAIYFLSGNSTFVFFSLFLGALVGYGYPMSWLEGQIRKRYDEVLYYLPLVIEQVSIGVSSSLDIGPCISNIIQMANERDSHNPITEMFIHVEKLIRSGLNLEDSLVEVAQANGMSEVEHAFMFLGQCAKHGGEVSKQLQELADAVMMQRQVQVEAKITSLPVKATGPLATVFAGFFALLFSGLIVRIMGAFSS